MIFVEIEAVKSEERGYAGGNGWFDTDDIREAVSLAFDRFSRTWDYLGHGAVVTYRITVAPEGSPKRTKGGRDWPLPVEAA